MVLDWPQVGVTAIASGLGTLVAAAIGFRYAVARFKRERSFDKQLEWYERATLQLIKTANELNWALAADLVPISAPDRLKAWANAHASLTALRGLELESAMYASPESFAALTEAVSDISTVAQAISDKRSALASSAPKLYEICVKLLRHAAARLADDVREHLELAPVERPWGIYDQELRELKDELESWKARGTDLSDGTWVGISIAPETPGRTMPSEPPNDR